MAISVLHVDDQVENLELTRLALAAAAPDSH